MTFVGTWIATVSYPLPGGTGFSTDTLTIPTEPTLGMKILMTRTDQLSFQGSTGLCKALITSKFELTVKTANATALTCSLADKGCVVSGATCSINCGAPGQLPDVSFSLIDDNTVSGTGGFDPAETFHRAAQDLLKASESGPIPRVYDAWRRAF